MMKTMKQRLNHAIACGLLALLPAISICHAVPANKNKPVPKKPAGKPAATINPIFYDTDWIYQTATLYDKGKNTVSSVAGNAVFKKDGTYQQDYYIGSIGNFFKGKYKLSGNRLTTYDEKGAKVFDYKLSIGSNPPIMVMSIFNDDGTKSMDFSLEAKPKTKK